MFVCKDFYAILESNKGRVLHTGLVFVECWKKLKQRVDIGEFHGSRISVVPRGRGKSQFV
jgi:hypothetical protein